MVERTTLLFSLWSIMDCVNFFNWRIVSCELCTGMSFSPQTTITFSGDLYWLYLVRNSLWASMTFPPMRQSKSTGLDGLKFGALHKWHKVLDPIRIVFVEVSTPGSEVLRLMWGLLLKTEDSSVHLAGSFTFFLRLSLSLVAPGRLADAAILPVDLVVVPYCSNSHR